MVLGYALLGRQITEHAGLVKIVATHKTILIRYVFEDQGKYRKNLLFQQPASAELYTPRLLVPAPVLFSLPGDGKGQGAIWHAATGEIASASNPAVAGAALSMYTTNLTSSGVIPPQVAIGGRLAHVLYFDTAPAYPGYNQVNFLIPSGVAPGPAVPVRLTYVGRPSNEVTIAVNGFGDQK